VQFSSFFLDKYVAPEISSFTEASIPDMSAITAEQGYWLVNFVLNSGFQVSMDDALRRTLYNFLRRTEAAFREYEVARQSTLEYLANRDAISGYIVAVGHWEVLLSQAYQAWCLLARGQRILFQPGDGSPMQRLNLLYNRAKHAEKAITAQQLPPDGTLPVWLKNNGLHCVESSLSFEEVAEILEDLAHWAEASQDPLTMREKLLAHTTNGPDVATISAE
jgi:hypothetical protein